jgi:menaquinone-dependent protoporphyrinogen IX oxidase
MKIKHFIQKYAEDIVSLAAAIFAIGLVALILFGFYHH